MAGDHSEPDWASLARHAPALATVRAFAEGSGAERVAVLLDDPGREPVLVECAPGAPIELTRGDEVFVLGVDATDGVAPLPVAVPRAAPGSAITADPETGEIHAPLGVIPALADGLMALARALGGRSIASADFPTRDADAPLTIAAREGEGIVVAVGDRQFEL